MLNGIDISNHQSKIDLKKVFRNTATDFVIVKATEGTHFVDKYCDRFYQVAKEAGKCLGIYHFARPDRNGAVEEAKFFVSNTKNYFGDAIPILDWETGNVANTGWAKEWLDTVYDLTGVRPMIYMSESVANSYNWKSVAGANYGLWVAKYRDFQRDYNYDMRRAGSKPKVKQWPVYAMWQWTSAGRLDGYNGDLDCNVFYGDRTAWNKYAGRSAKSVQEIAREVIDGKWGNGEERKERLTKAGYSYKEVQDKVNELLR